MSAPEAPGPIEPWQYNPGEPDRLSPLGQLAAVEETAAFGHGRAEGGYRAATALSGVLDSVDSLCRAAFRHGDIQAGNEWLAQMQAMGERMRGSLPLLPSGVEASIAKLRVVAALYDPAAADALAAMTATREGRIPVLIPLMEACAEEDLPPNTRIAVFAQNADERAMAWDAYVRARARAAEEKGESLRLGEDATLRAGAHDFVRGVIAQGSAGYQTDPQGLRGGSAIGFAASAYRLAANNGEKIGVIEALTHSLIRQGEGGRAWGEWGRATSSSERADSDEPLSSTPHLNGIEAARVLDMVGLVSADAAIAYADKRALLGQVDAILREGHLPVAHIDDFRMIFNVAVAVASGRGAVNILTAPDGVGAVPQDASLVEGVRLFSRAGALDQALVLLPRIRGTDNWLTAFQQFVLAGGSVDHAQMADMFARVEHEESGGQPSRGPDWTAREQAMEFLSQMSADPPGYQAARGTLLDMAQTAGGEQFANGRPLLLCLRRLLEQDPTSLDIGPEIEARLERQPAVLFEVYALFAAHGSAEMAERAWRRNDELLAREGDRLGYLQRYARIAVSAAAIAPPGVSSGPSEAGG